MSKLLFSSYSVDIFISVAFQAYQYHGLIASANSMYCYSTIQLLHKRLVATAVVWTCLGYHKSKVEGVMHFLHSNQRHLDS